MRPLVQGCAIFQKISKPSQKSRIQKDDMHTEDVQNSVATATLRTGLCIPGFVYNELENTRK